MSLLQEGLSCIISNIIFTVHLRPDFSKSSRCWIKASFTSSDIRTIRLLRKGGNEKVWYRVDTEDSTLNNKEFLLELRKSWQDIANKHLAPEHQIDCRSLEEQGITDREPDIHISPTVLAMEKKNPGSTEKMRIHNEIKERNNLPKIIEAIKNIQNELTTIFTRKRKFFHEAYKHHKERLEAFRMAESKTNVETWTPPKTPPETRSTPTPWFAKGQNKKQNKSWEPER